MALILTRSIHSLRAPSPVVSVWKMVITGVQQEKALVPCSKGPSLGVWRWQSFAPQPWIRRVFWQVSSTCCEQSHGES